jgi:hypothetical protein
VKGVAAVLLVLAVFPAIAALSQVSPPCIGANLAGTFGEVPGSAGAGNITYALRLRNTSSASCFVSGIPAYRLRVEASGGGSLLVPIRPPTAVCEHGRMTFTVLTLASG